MSFASLLLFSFKHKDPVWIQAPLERSTAFHVVTENGGVSKKKGKKKRKGKKKKKKKKTIQINDIYLLKGLLKRSQLQLGRVSTIPPL